MNNDKLRQAGEKFRERLILPVLVEELKKWKAMRYTDARSQRTGKKAA